MENQMSDQNLNDGHEVTMISDCYEFHNGEIVEVDECDFVLQNGLRLIRLRYHRFINEFISRKVLMIDGLYKLICELSPDVIVYHGVVGQALMPTADYLSEHKNVRFYIICHEDFYNSGHNIISEIFQYKIMYRHFVNKITPYVKKFWAITYSCYSFLEKMYGIPESKIEDYPLGGVVPSEGDRRRYRLEKRKELGIDAEDILLMHSGKMDKGKKTVQILNALANIGYERLKLVIIGAFPEETKEELESAVARDSRVQFIGWKSGEELLKYLCASDLYIQPGGASATLQNAVCCGTAVAVYPFDIYKHLLGRKAFYVASEKDITDLLKTISIDRGSLEEMRDNSFDFAKKELDYKVLAARIY